MRDRVDARPGKCVARTRHEEWGSATTRPHDQRAPRHRGPISKAGVRGWVVRGGTDIPRTPACRARSGKSRLAGGVFRRRRLCRRSRRAGGRRLTAPHWRGAGLPPPGGSECGGPDRPDNVWGSAVWEARSRRTRPAVATRGEGTVDRRDEVGTRLADGRWRTGRSGETPLAPVAHSPCPGDLHGAITRSNVASLR
jgi:hypothetical protein